MSTNAQGDPIAQIQATTKGIAQGLGVLLKQASAIDPTGGGVGQMIMQMIDGISAIEQAIQQPPQQAMGVPAPRMSDGPYEDAGRGAQAMLAAQAMQQQQGGY